jgi:type 1 glutamine amidotransferase/sugar phosphate isomerase/epimerase
MKKHRLWTILSVTAGILAGPSLLSAQIPAGRDGGAAQSPTGGRGGGGRGGANVDPSRGSLSVRIEDWGRLHTAASGLLGWKVGVPAVAFRQLTFSEAAAKVDALYMSFIEGSSTQNLSPEIPKKVDFNLAPGEVTAVKTRLSLLNLRMPAYFTPAIGPDEASSRKLFAFAKDLGVETIVSAPDPASLAEIDRLANEYGVNVALYSLGRKETPAYWDPKAAVSLLEGRSKRIGLWADFGAWMEEGIKPLDGIELAKDRVIAVNLRDRSALGSKGRDTVLGAGVAGIPAVIQEMYRLGIKPSFIGVDTDGPEETAALTRSIDSLDKALQPVITEYVDNFSRSVPIKGVERLNAADKQKIDAALPQQAPAKPQKSRKLLVLDLNVNYGGAAGGHASIPHVNYALETMGKQTGAYTAVFSNDLSNLKYDKIKQFDAVFLNNTVGILFPDPEVREGILRFVREGGGLGGNHGTSHIEMDWPEFHEMLGAWRGIHRENTEEAWVKIDDPNSPITVAFSGKEFLRQDEFFRFPIGPTSREKLHVLLSMDVAKTDMNQGRACAQPCSRPDNDYALSWIRSYGKGRVFFCAMGHQPTLFMSPEISRFLLAAIQFMLGDLEADTTPSAKLAAR